MALDLLKKSGEQIKASDLSTMEQALLAVRAGLGTSNQTTPNVLAVLNDLRNLLTAIKLEGVKEEEQNVMNILSSSVVFSSSDDLYTFDEPLLASSIAIKLISGDVSETYGIFATVGDNNNSGHWLPKINDVCYLLFPKPQLITGLKSYGIATSSMNCSICVMYK